MENRIEILPAARSRWFDTTDFFQTIGMRFNTAVLFVLNTATLLVLLQIYLYNIIVFNSLYILRIEEV